MRGLEHVALLCQKQYHVDLILPETRPCLQGDLEGFDRQASQDKICNRGREAGQTVTAAHTAGAIGGLDFGEQAISPSKEEPCAKVSYRLGREGGLSSASQFLTRGKLIKTPSTTELSAPFSRRCEGIS